MIFSQWGRPQVDVFAAPENHKLPVWFSRTDCPGTQGRDAMNQSWTGLYIYAFPLTNMIFKTLLKIRDESVEEAILIAPDWPRREWYPLLEDMLTEKLPLQLRIDLLSQVLTNRGTLFHPDLPSQRLAAWRLNGKLGKMPAFREK